MSKFKKGEIIVRNSHTIPGNPMNAKAGARAVVVDPNPSWNRGRTVGVRWLGDVSQNDGVYYDASFDSLNGESVNSAVDDLIERYATALRTAIDNDTLVAPYSEIGIFASFLLDYKRLTND